MNLDLFAGRGVLSLGLEFRGLAGVERHQAVRHGGPLVIAGRQVLPGPLPGVGDQVLGQHAFGRQGPHPLGAVAADHRGRVAGIDKDPHEGPLVDDGLEPLADLVIDDAVGDPARLVVFEREHVPRAEDLVHAVGFVVLDPVVVGRHRLLRTVAGQEDHDHVARLGPSGQTGEPLADVLAGRKAVLPVFSQDRHVLRQEAVALHQHCAAAGRRCCPDRPVAPRRSVPGTSCNRPATHGVPQWRSNRREPGPRFRVFAATNRSDATTQKA